jgi:hypothetical protein
MATQPALASRTEPIHGMPETRPELGWIRASGLAQARLQLAVLSGNRHRALEQIDRLIGIDRQLERLARGESTPDEAALEADLADQRLAIASEKLALTSGIDLPRLGPAFAAAASEEPEIVEDVALKGRLFHLMLWGAGFLVLCVGVAAAAVTQL